MESLIPKPVKQICIAFLLISLLIIKGFSQSETAVPFMLIQPSPHLNGMAGAFTALPTNDPFGQYYNPAQLGSFARENNLAYSFYVAESHWLPSFNFSDLTFESKALSLGYNLQNIFPNIPITIGMGYLHTLLNLGNNIWTDEEGNIIGEFESKEYYTAYSIGIGFDYFIRLNFGYTYKDITSDLGFEGVGVGQDDLIGRANTDAYDIGLQITAPIISIIERLTYRELTVDEVFRPFFELHYGYSVKNVGNEIYYIDERQKDPLPRTAQIGAALSMGFNVSIKNRLFQAVRLEYSSDARDLLVDRGEHGGFQYISAPGEIDFWDNVICGKSTNNVYLYRGWRLDLFDFFEFSKGYYDGAGYVNGSINTSGYSVKTKGLLKLLAVYKKNSTLTFIANRFELIYSHSSYSNIYSLLSGTEFDGLTLNVFGF